MAEPNEEQLTFIQQWLQNFKPSVDGSANPRGIATSGLSAVNPALGFAASLPWARVARAVAGILGIGGKGGEGDVEAFTPEPGSQPGQGIADLDFIQALQESPLGGLPSNPGLAEGGASDIGAVDISQILFDPALAAQAGQSDTFDMTDFATQAMQAFTAAQNDALVNQFGQQGGSISNAAGFLSDPNARFGAGFDEVGAALAAKGGGGGFRSGGGGFRFLR
jgi:hypothetical protein